MTGGGVPGRVLAAFVARLAEVAERFGRTLTVPGEELIRWLFAVHDGGVARSYVEGDGTDDITRRAVPLLVDAVSR